MPDFTVQTSSGPTLEITMLGQFSVLIDGTPIGRLRSETCRSLLALLLLRHDREVRRSWLAETLWPDSEREKALANLRLNLHDLRRALGVASVYIEAPSAHTLRFNCAGANLDLARFDRGLNGGERARAAAVECYQGPLLEDFQEDWAIGEREARRQQYLRLLEETAQNALDKQELSEAIRYLRLTMAADPRREPAARSLMRALVQHGDHAAALTVYHNLLSVVARPFQETIQLYEQIRGMRPKLPPPPPQPPNGSIPSPITSLIGRSQMIAEVKELLQGCRALTLTGPGGVGKTRLAIATADSARHSYSDYAWFVDLSAISKPGLVAYTVLKLLEIKPAGRTGSDMETLISGIGARSLLLVLDNCEHLIDAVAELTLAVLTRCPNVRVLATSREPLGVGEQVYPIGPLATPPVDVWPIESRVTGVMLAELLHYSAVHLFVVRARSANPGFLLTADNALHVIRIVHRLDGIPLAIELAAARAARSGIAQIDSGLYDYFERKLPGRSSAPQRHQTLHAAIDWSFGLLSREEALLMTNLSVFAGGWTLEAAAAICGDGTSSEFDTDNLLSSLAEKSLIFQMPGAPVGIRYRMLETVRQYCLTRRRASIPGDSVARRHALWFLEFAERADAGLRGPDQQAWLHRLEADHDNLRAAHEGSIEAGEYETAVKLTGALGHFWEVKGYLTEGRQRLERSLNGGGPCEPNAWARALTALGLICDLQGESAVAVQWVETAAALYTESGDRRGQAYSKIILGHICRHCDATRAEKLLTEAMGIARDIRDPWLLANSLNTIGWHRFHRDMREDAERCFQEALGHARVTENLWMLDETYYHLALVSGSAGNYERSYSLFSKCLENARKLGEKTRLSKTLHYLAEIEFHRKEYQAAELHWNESLTLAKQENNRRTLLAALTGYMKLAVETGLSEDAARLYREISRLRETVDTPLFDLSTTSSASSMRRIAETMAQENRSAPVLNAPTSDADLKLQGAHDPCAMAHTIQAVANSKALLAVTRKVQGYQ